MQRIAFAAVGAALLAGCSSPKPPAPAYPVAPQVAEAADPCAKYTDPTTNARCRLYTGADAWRFVPEAGRSADLDTQLRCAPFRRNSGPYENCIRGTLAQVVEPAAGPSIRAPAGVEPNAPAVAVARPRTPPAEPAAPAVVAPSTLETPAPKQVQRQAEPRDTMADLQAQKNEPERKLAATERRLYDLIRNPLNDFLAGPRGNCASESLGEAAASAIYSGMAPDDLSRRQRGAGWVLDVADGAADHGCPDLARKLYRHVIETYIGWGYAAHRQRAEIGLADLRGSS